MDQVRKILAWLKEQHFWVLSGLIAVIAIFCWWSASGTLYSEFEANKQTIESEFTSLTSLRSKPFHPNDEINQRQLKEATDQAKYVRDMWQKLYDAQREHVLKWPIPPLSQSFGEHVEAKQFGDAIDREFRTEYQNYARRYFPELPKIVGAREMPEGQGGAYGGENPYGGRGGGYGEYGRGGGYGPGNVGLDSGLAEDDGDYICEWLDQNVVREMLRFPQRPSSIKIWVTQEDLWVYETLLDVIRRTNEAAGATRISNAAVKVIYQLQVGRDAAAFSRGKGRVYMVPSAAPAGDSMVGGEGGEMAGGEMGRMGNPYANPYGGAAGGGYGEDMGRLGGAYGAPGGGPMTEEQEEAFLTGGRYLDEQGKPIGGAASMGGEGGAMADPTAAATPTDPGSFGVEYKRLPVRMVLKMDQRWLTHLIAECANQPLQVEVREVRLNPAGIGEGGGGGGMLGGGYGGGYGGRGYEGGGGAAGSLFPELTGVQTFPAQPNIINVEIQGIIYIFNEPNPTVLQVSDEPQVTASL